MVALGDWLACYRVDDRVGIYIIWDQGTGWFRSQRHMATVAMLWGLVNFRDFYPATLVQGSTPSGKRNCPKVS